MVRRGDGPRVNYRKLGGGDDSDKEEDSEQDYSEEEQDDEEDEDYGAKKKSPVKRSFSGAARGRGRGRVKRGATRGRGRTRTPRGPRSKISKRKYATSSRMSGRPKHNVSYTYDSDEEEEEEESEEEEEFDFNAYHRGGRGGQRKRGRYEEEEEDSDEDYESEESDDDTFRGRPARGRARGKGVGRGRGRGGGRSGRPSKVPPRRNESLPPVKVMVIESIKALKDHPRKGSTLGSIKETITLNWPVDMSRYDHRIKKYIRNALATEELLQPKGRGLRGRFTVPGMKGVKRKRRKRKKEDKSDEEVEYEYKPQKTVRDEERERHQEELERRRQERRLWEEEKANEKMNRPKKASKKVSKNKEWAVEAIKGKKMVGGEVFYLVKFEGYTKPQWEPEENVDGCVYVEFFEQEQAKKRMMDEERRRREDQEGAYEVRRVLDMRKVFGGRREFFIRWVGHGPEDDSWEPEGNLDCQDLIDKFMAKLEAEKNVVHRNLREAPAKVQRLEFASSRRERKRHGGFRISYAGMDED